MLCPRHQMDDEEDYRQGEKYMDQSADDMKYEKRADPRDEQQNCDGKKQEFHFESS